MTRINCIPPKELSDKHLVAEYRELPRVFRLARHAPDAPPQYTMGRGHVMFFYNKLAWCHRRQQQLVEEMNRRGFTTNFEPSALITWQSLKPDLWQDWVPTPEAMAINRARIKERLDGK